MGNAVQRADWPGSPDPARHQTKRAGCASKPACSVGKKGHINIGEHQSQYPATGGRICPPASATREYLDAAVDGGSAATSISKDPPLAPGRLRRAGLRLKYGGRAASMAARAGGEVPGLSHSSAARALCGHWQPSSSCWAETAPLAGRCWSKHGVRRKSAPPVRCFTTAARISACR